MMSLVQSDTATVDICLLPASIAAAPDQKTMKGQVVRLQLGVISGATPTYLWYSGASGNTSTPISGEQAANYIDVGPNTTTQYWAQVKAGGCTSATGTTTVSVCIPRVTSPSGVVVAVNQPTTLTAGSDIPNVTFQWYAGASGTTTSPIGGATSASYTAVTATTTSYWARVTGSCGDYRDSASATVTICNPAAITAGSPADVTLPVSNINGTLTVSATGTNLTYQWYAGSSGVTASPVSRATGASLTRNGTSTAQYWVRVTGACGASVDSRTAYISAPPNIITQPADVYMSAGSHANFDVTASGSFLSYQWYLGSTPVGTGLREYVTGALSAATSAYVTVSSGTAPRDSRGASINICNGPQVTYGPVASGTGSSRNLVLGTSNPDAYIEWYQGAVGNDAALVAYGYGYTNVWVTVPVGTTTYWARLRAPDPGYGDPNNGCDCYSDSNGVTVTR